MKVLAACAVVAGSSIGLLGCGSGSDDAAPAPTPVAWPMDVATVWQHHFDAFVAKDANKIILDYDADSVVSIFDDTCPATQGLSYFKGEDQIKTMFEGLFSDLGPIANVIEVGPEAEAPHAKVINEKGPGGNAFLVWKTKGGADGLAADKWIQYATDTFSFKTLDNGKYKIAKQNIVVTKKDTACEGNPDGKVVKPGDGRTTKIDLAWDNHFQGFGGADLDKIMLDYTEGSIVQVYDWTAAAADRFKVYKGLAEIRDMFAALFLTLNPDYSSTDPNVDKKPLGVDVPLQTFDEDLKAIFLVWVSTHVKHATDTFIFDDSGDKAIILRQNIVVHDTPQPYPTQLQIEV